MRLGLVVMLVVMALGTAATAEPAAKERAAKLVMEGSEQFRQKRFEAALAKYREAYELYPSPKLHYNLALALASMGRETEAANAYARFLAEDDGESPPAARRDAEKALAGLQRKLGRLSIASTVAGTTVSVDGSDVGAPPIVVHVIPGRHAVKVVAPGRKPTQWNIEVPAGTVTAVAADPMLVDLKVNRDVSDPGDPRDPPPVTPAKRSILTRWWLWTAVGVVAVGVGGYFVFGRDGAPDSELGVFEF